MPDPEILADCWEQGVDDGVAYAMGDNYRFTAYADEDLRVAYIMGMHDFLYLDDGDTLVNPYV